MAALASARSLLAEDEQGPVNNPFILLLKGIYQPVPHLLNLGLAGVNLVEHVVHENEDLPRYRSARRRSTTSTARQEKDLIKRQKQQEDVYSNIRKACDAR